MATNEIWKDIYGYEGIYQVSNFGQVRRLCKNDNRVIKQEINRGYKRVCLSYKNVKKHFLVHRLVAFAFIPNPNNYPIINHKDENKLNNNVDNLEWCTYSYNLSYNGLRYKMAETRKNNGYIVSDITRKKLSNINIGNKNHKKYQCYIMCDKDTFKEIHKFYTILDIEKYFNKKIKMSNIYSCIKGNKLTAYGFNWKGETN